MKVKGVIAYDGSQFFGMEKQPGLKTVQGELERALRRLGIVSKVEYSGRTDRGVHATGQVISFEVPSYWEGNLPKLGRELTRHLRGEVVVKRLTPAPADFHPRFSAKWRSYRYLISPHLTPFNRLYLYHYPHPLEVEKLNRFAKLIEGEHDFRLFAKTGSNPSHYRRTIYLARFYRWKGLVVFKIVGNGFLRGQVRLLVQFLLQMGEGKLGERELLEQLEGKRLHLKLPAPPTGLYLTGVGF